MEQEKPPVRPIADEMEITLGEEQEGCRFAIRSAAETIQRLSVRMTRGGSTGHVPGMRDAHGRMRDVLQSLEHGLDAGNRELSKISAAKFVDALKVVALALLLLPGVLGATVVTNTPTPTVTPGLTPPTKTPPATETKTPPPTNSPVPTETKIPPTKDPTPTWTPTSSPTPTSTLTATVVPSSTPSSSPTSTPTASATPTASPSASTTPTVSPSRTGTPRPAPSPTPSIEPSPTPTGPPTIPVPLDGRALGAIAVGIAVGGYFIARRMQ